MEIDYAETFCPKSAQEWRKWLEAHHAVKEFVWVILYKKSAPHPTISWSDMVDEALCFGWIDSIRKTLDSEKYIQYYGKRKPNGTWSAINKEKVTLLMEKGLMTEAGLRCIEIAKQNGSWTFLDAVDALLIPDDLAMEFDKRTGSHDYFLSLSKSVKKLLLYWIVSAKRPETRQKRILDIAKNAEMGLKPKQFR